MNRMPCDICGASVVVREDHPVDWAICRKCHDDAAKPECEDCATRPNGHRHPSPNPAREVKP